MLARHPDLDVRLARNPRDLRGAERLRYRVFVEELGGQGPLVDHDARLERDRFDAECEHMVLVDRRRDPEGLDHVVGVYRLLDAAGAARAGGFYGEAEYDLDPLRRTGRRLLELGRSCLDRQFRGGTGMLQLWQGLAKYVTDHGYDVLFGVASFQGTDPAALSQPLAMLHHRHLAPAPLRVRSRTYQPMDLIPDNDIDRLAAMRAMPALIKAYLRLGGVVGDGAFVDHDFNTTDVCLVLDTGTLATTQRAIYAGPAR